MHIALARAYVKKLEGLLLDLEDQHTPQERFPLVLRMQDLVQPLYIVNSGAAQHIEEALRKLKYPDAPVVNAALATIRQSLQKFTQSIQTHGSNNFLLRGPQRTFVKPVAELELRSLVEKKRLFDHEHNPFVMALGAEERPVEKALLEARGDELKTVLHRMGFAHTDALIFFQTDAVPALGKPTENVPSLSIYKFRSGAPVHILKHRVL